jgi:3-phenylpropionate/trans-cinnamate dioxygenase ferredoxin component
VSELEVCRLEELPPGSTRIVEVRPFLSIGVYNCEGALYALEDRCSHDDGPLCEGEWEPETCQVVCPRHGARFDIRTGAALLLPAYMPVDTYPVRVNDDGVVVVDIPE